MIESKLVHKQTNQWSAFYIQCTAHFPDERIITLMISLFGSFWNIAKHIILCYNIKQMWICCILSVRRRLVEPSLACLLSAALTLLLRDYECQRYLQLSLLTADNLLFLHWISEFRGSPNRCSYVFLPCVAEIDPQIQKYQSAEPLLRECSQRWGLSALFASS